jgi:hypothetical protein
VIFLRTIHDFPIWDRALLELMEASLGVVAVTLLGVAISRRCKLDRSSRQKEFEHDLQHRTSDA